MGDLNIDFRTPQTEQEEIIADFLDNINVVNASHKYIQCKGKRQGLGAQWTWWQRRDYVMAREGDMKAFWNVASWRLGYHDKDHQAVVAAISKGRKGRLKNYRRSRQKFHLQLPPVELQDGVTEIFRELRGECNEKDPVSCLWNNWISKEIWGLIAHQAMLRHSGRLCQRGGHCLH